MRSNKPTHDTYREAIAMMAQHVLNSVLHFFVGYPQAPLEKRLQELRDIASGEREASSAYTSLRVEFRRAGTSCDLYVNPVSYDRSYIDERHTQDDEGNEYFQTGFKFEVSWPCHGDTDPAACLARLELYREVSVLAATLQAEFGDVYFRLYRTKAQREEQQAREIENARRQAVEAAVTRAYVGGNMRVGSERFVEDTSQLSKATVPNGRYEVEAPNGKKFAMVVEAFPDGRYTALVTRTA